MCRVPLFWRTISTKLAVVGGDNSFSARINGRHRKVSLYETLLDLGFSFRLESLFSRRESRAFGMAVSFGLKSKRRSSTTGKL